MDQVSSLKNSFLIALPSLDDQGFSRTVTYICDHDEHGAMGLVLNRPSELYLGDVLKYMDIKPVTAKTDRQTIFIGGPVETDRGFILHPPDSTWKSTQQLSDDLCITTSRDILEALASGEGPEQSFVALGYAGWSAGQLEHELQQDSWIYGPANPDIIFNLVAKSRWEAAAKLLGIDVRLINSTAGHA